MATLIGVCIVAFAAGVILTQLTRVMAQSFGAIDVPNERSSHVAPTPRGGGVSFVVITLIAAAWAAYTTGSTPLAMYFICSLGIAVVSLVDDIRTLSATTRLAVHLIAAAGFVTFIRPFVSLGPAILMAVAAVLWIVSLTNIFNFMDGIDGIAASQAVVTFTSMGVFALVVGESSLTLILLSAACATAGFLMINWPPARVFMGDVGSAFLGFSSGCLAILSSDPRMLVVAFSATWPFLFDATLTLGRRLTRGENVLRSHRSHYYQRLVIAGYSHQSVTLLYAICALAGGVAGLLSALDLIPIWPAVAAAATVSVTLLLLVSRAEKKTVTVSD